MMVSVFMISSSILLVMETLAGMVANGSIVLINYIDWFRSRKLSPNEQILTCLGLSRFVWLLVVIMDQKVHLFSVGTHNCHYIYVILPIVWILTNTTTVWFTTWLSVFYLAKITTFSNPVFLQVKLRISGLVPWLLLASVVFSTIMAIVIVSSLTNGFSMCDSNKSCLNISDSEIKFPDIYVYIDLLANAPNIIPLMIFLPSSILLMTSLWMHTRCMQRNGIGIRDLNTEVHLTAIKALASFAVLHLSSFLAVTVQAMLIRNKMSDSWQFMLLSNVSVSCPSGHPIILILINPKLKQAWVRMLLHLKCCSSEMPSQNLPQDHRDGTFCCTRRTLRNSCSTILQETLHG